MAQLAMWYVKGDNEPVNVQLVRLPVNDFFSSENVALLQPANSGTEIKVSAVSITDPSLQTVDNARFAYAIAQCLSDEEKFISARSRYTYSDAGD